LRLTTGRQDFVFLHRQQISNDPNQLSQSDPLISIDLLPVQYLFVRSEYFIDKATVTEDTLITFAKALS
jgi:hypothetical protein